MVTETDLANSIRALAMDAVQQANSGHPGMPMGMAEIAVALWGAHTDHHCFYRHNPNNPDWPNRDRFVLSNGHGSMLQYALLHLSGYDLPMEEIKRFRQLHSKTPGHPEVGYTPGVETTTGPLGQGLANAVGMALAEKQLAHEFNRPGFDIVDHYTWVFLGDGCLMEGISHEACALAGTWGLGKLIMFWDDNGISIDGHVKDWFTDDTPRRFEAYGWHVVRDIDGHNVSAVRNAIKKAQAAAHQPSLICCKTIIGKGSPNKAGSHDCHGAPLGEEEVKATRAAIGWPYPPFFIPPDIYKAWDKKTVGQQWEAAWQQQFEKYAKQYPELASEFQRRVKGTLPDHWKTIKADMITHVNDEAQTIASRKASQNALNILAPHLPELLGGSADLTGSNLTNWKGCGAPMTRQGSVLVGRHISYGVREFGMSAIINGLSRHGGLRPFGGTFLMFCEYALNAVRMAALMKLNVIFVYTHDSIGLGEDGPTHQPVEQLQTLRCIPNLDVWRAADSLEAAVAWAVALEQTGRPSALVFSRQNLVFQKRSPEQIAQIQQGGYVLCQTAKRSPQLVLIASGSEVDLAVKAWNSLNAAGIASNLVSMPSTSVFDRQDQTYRDHVLPQGVPRLAIEAASSDFWRKYVGLEGGVIGLDRFGESAPASQLFKEFGFTPEHLVERAKALIG